MVRRVLIVIVTLVGWVGVSATSPAVGPSFDVASSEKSITLVLDEALPEVRFLVDVASSVVDDIGVSLSVNVTVTDDAAAPAAAGVAVLDVGLVQPFSPLPANVELAADPSMAAVRAGESSIERIMDGPQLVLVARKTQTAGSVRATFALVASTMVFGSSAPGADEVLTISVSPDSAFAGEGEGE